MSVTVIKKQLWKWIQDDNNSIIMDIFWKDFNPRQPSGMFEWTLDEANIYLRNQTTSFNCSGLAMWHEVAIALFAIENTSGSAESGSLGFKRKKASDLLFESSNSYYLPNNTWWLIYSYIWIDRDEIQENWTDYKIEFYLGWSLNDSITFTISNLSIDNTDRTPGYIWVEWNNIHYIDATKTYTWFEHIIAHDWSTYWSWLTPWYIRVDTSNHWRLYYIDSSGYKRRTHLADDWSWYNTGWWDELPISWETPWFIRVSTWSYGYLCFIWYDWKGYRIMNWAV